jgi:hypothetical protein
MDYSSTSHSLLCLAKGSLLITYHLVDSVALAFEQIHKESIQLKLRLPSQ